MTEHYWKKKIIAHGMLLGQIKSLISTYAKSVLKIDENTLRTFINLKCDDSKVNFGLNKLAPLGNVLFTLPQKNGLLTTDWRHSYRSYTQMILMEKVY